MSGAIDFTSVTRSFGSIRAVDDLSFYAPYGTVTVLLGPNGAGKTTTVRLSTGALSCDSGHIRVLGLDPALRGQELRRRCGVIPPKPAFYDQLTGRENLVFAARLFDAPAGGAEEAAERFGIRHALDRAVAEYSTGMRARLALARSIIHKPEILLLDEPTAGLDPESSRAVLECIRELAGSGRVVLMCTHLLHEAEGLADQVILMNEGSARAGGHPSDLVARVMPDPVVILDAENRHLLEKLRHRQGVLGVKWDGGAHVTLDCIDRIPEIVTYLVGSGARLTRVEPLVPSLEDLYFEMQQAPQRFA